MTIREHLTNKIRLFFGVAMLFWLLFAGSIVLDNVVPSWILSTIAFCGFGASVLCVIFLVRCPRCEGKLGAHGLVQPFGFDGPVCSSRSSVRFVECVWMIKCSSNKRDAR